MRIRFADAGDYEINARETSPGVLLGGCRNLDFPENATRWMGIIAGDARSRGRWEFADWDFER
ncbi:MAG: hypothetical protein AAF763_03440 [Pseudomonadota bacterium]